MASPTLLVIPGSFSTAQMYYSVLSSLKTLAPTLETYVNNLPSAIRNPPEEPATLQDDATFFRSIIDKIASSGDGKDVILMAHSYGGLVATETVKGVTKREREAQGLKGGVVRIVYLAAHAPGQGNSLFGVVGAPPAGMVEVGEDHFIRFVDVETIAKGTLPDVPLPVAVEVVKSMGRHSNASFTSEVTHSGYKDVPVSWILTELDFIVPGELQKKYIETIERESGNKVDVHTIQTGHAPNASAPEALAGILAKVIEAGK